MDSLSGAEGAWSQSGSQVHNLPEGVTEARIKAEHLETSPLEIHPGKHRPQKQAGAAGDAHQPADAADARANRKDRGGEQ